LIGIDGKAGGQRQRPLIEAFDRQQLVAEWPFAGAASADAQPPDVRYASCSAIAWPHVLCEGVVRTSTHRG
jgi:hypothetical protein